jgi:hypothetical protein
MTGHRANAIENSASHMPNWQAAETQVLDWRFVSTDPVAKIAATSIAQSEAANENRPPMSLRDRALHIVLTMVATALLCAIAAAAVAGLYIVKSALGIDLFAGHSFLHDWLYVRG